VASHDLKEPVRKISIFCHMLQAENPKQEALIDKIRNACGRMSTLIDDILEYSFIARKSQVVRQDLNIILQNALSSLEEQIKDKMAIVHAKPLPVAKVIPYQMEQLFQNLISNALKFNESQSPVIKISQRLVTDEEAELYSINANGYIAICVEDNGIGFDSRYKDKIFGIFQRLHNNLYQGTGIGLAICKKIVDRHGGRIWSDSQPGKGTTFYFTLDQKMKEGVLAE